MQDLSTLVQENNEKTNVEDMNVFGTTERVASFATIALRGELRQLRFARRDDNSLIEVDGKVKIEGGIKASGAGVVFFELAEWVPAGSALPELDGVRYIAEAQVNIRRRKGRGDSNVYYTNFIAESLSFRPLGDNERFDFDR